MLLFPYISPSNPLSPCPQVYSALFLHCCPVSKFFSTIFPDSAYVCRIQGQEYWSGLPFPSPVHESEKWKWSCSVVSDSSRPHGLQPIRLLHPWDFPGESTGVGCHCLLQEMLDTISIFLNLLRFDFWPKMSIVKNVPYPGKYPQKKVYSSAIWCNALKISMRSISSNISFKTCFLINFLFWWLVHWCEWGIKVSYSYCVTVNFSFYVC